MHIIGTTPLASNFTSSRYKVQGDFREKDVFGTSSTESQEVKGRYESLSV